MKNLRKISSLALAALMFFCLFNIGSFAVGTPAGNEFMSVVVKTNVNEVYPGEYITVTLNITNNYYAMVMRFPVMFTKDAFEVEESSLNLQKSGQLNTVTGDIDYAADNFPESFFTPSCGADNYGGLLIQWNGTANAGLFGCYNQPSGQDCISFRLKVKAGYDGACSILIPSDSTLFSRLAMNDPAVGPSYYTMTDTQLTMNFTPANLTSQIQMPDIDKYPDSDTVIDRDSGLIYGLEENLTSLDDRIIGIDGATFEVVKSDGSFCGTGTAVKVIKNSTVVKTYKVVIFGDLDGNASVATEDADILVNYLNYWLPVWNEPAYYCYIFAGDVYHDGIPDENDCCVIRDCANWASVIDQKTGFAHPIE